MGYEAYLKTEKSEFMVPIGATSYNNYEIYKKLFGCGLRELYGKKFSDLKQLLENGLNEIKNNPAYYQSLIKGMGRISQVFEFLKNTYILMRKYPRRILCVC